AIGAQRISVLTPYSVATSTPMERLFDAEGFSVARFTCLDMEDDRAMARIPPDEILAFARDAVAEGSDVLFISCTALRAAGSIERIEATVGVPVLSSNYAVAWNILRLLKDPGQGAAGHLMTLPL